MSATDMIFIDPFSLAACQHDAQVVPGMRRNRHDEASCAGFPQPAKDKCGYGAQQHQAGAVVECMHCAENQGDQDVGQADRADLSLKLRQQPVVQTQSEHGFLGNRGQYQQSQQGRRGAGGGTQSQTNLEREPGADRTADKGQGVAAMFGGGGGRNQWGHAWRIIVALVLSAPPALSFAGLGQDQSSVNLDRRRMDARHQVKPGAQYSLHELQTTDGSRVRQYVAANGMVFAVSWHTLYKPDLSTLLGPSYPAYAVSAQAAARRPGMQRQFRHEDLDLVLHSSAHLNVFSGFAFRRAMLPRGLDPHSIGLE